MNKRFLCMILSIVTIVIILGCSGEKSEDVGKIYVEPVTFEIVENTDVSEIIVAMSSKTEDAEIFYTTDMTTPTSSSNKYTEELIVKNNTVFSAIAIKAGLRNSPVSYANVSITEKKVEVIDKDDITIPLDVTNLQVIPKDGRVLLTWIDVPDDEIFGYEVSYNGTSPINRAISTIISENSMIVSPGAEGCYINGLTNGVEYSFTVKSINKYENTSEGVTVKSTPLASTEANSMTIELSASETPTNTNIDINITINSENPIKKVVVKKNGSINARKLLADVEAEDITEMTKIDGRFSISASSEDSGNGIYTVAALDEAGREEVEQIQIDQFDFTPPLPVSSASALYNYQKNIVTLNWTNPSSVDFDHIEISYKTVVGLTYGNESSIYSVNEATSKTFNVKAGDEESAQIYEYYIKTVDVVGNKSSPVIRTVSVESGINNIYQFHDTVEYLPVGTTNGTAGTSGTYVYFGDWPQTIKENEISIYETHAKMIGDFVYYLGSDDCWYAKCTENAFGTGYLYSNNTEVAKSDSNSTKYFKVEPIKWRILNPNAAGQEKLILLSENILIAGINYCNTPMYSANWDRKLTIDGSEIIIQDNNYKYSNIRAYLNGSQNQYVTDGGNNDPYYDDWTNRGFLQTAFTNSAQALIGSTLVNNTARSTNPDKNANKFNNGNNDNACDDTYDKIFLLSEQEVTKAEYGFSDYNMYGVNNSRIRFPTDFAMANYAYKGPENINGGYWWLRSPGVGLGISVHSVGVLGIADGSEDIGARTNHVGIVPALCLENTRE